MTGVRKWVVGLFFALLLLPLLRADDTNEQVVERYEQILEREPVEGPSLDKLLQIYQNGEGLEKLDARWAAKPADKGATYSLLRGLLADRMGKTDDARKYLQAATVAAPDDFHGWMALGDFEVREGKWTDAITALQKGLATKVTGDDRLSLYRKLGQAQERNLDVTAALATWQKMVEEFPKDSFALEEAGGAELDAEQFDEAKKTFQKLVDLTEPNSMNRVQALMRLADVDDRQGKTDAAVHDYEAILPLTAESSWLNRELRAQIEQVYRRQDDLAGLVTYYQKWTTDNPKDVEALLLLAGTLNELGKKPEALDVLRKVTALAPDRHEVRESFAQALVDAKQYDEAITVLTALTADDPTEPRYWETMGDALWLKTQPATADSKKATLDAWSHIAPAASTDVAAILQVADICREHELNDDALAGYNRALKLSPDASDIREKAVKLLVDLKREDEAWKLLDAMTDGPLATAANYLKLATLDLQFSRKDAAEAAIQKGLALEPGNFDLLSQQWSLDAEAQKWTDCIALFDKLMAAAPNAYFVDQLEARQLQALTSAGQLDARSKELHAKLGATPGMSEAELRLLLRMLIQEADPDVPKALAEAKTRFPQSVSLIRIEIDYDRHQGNYDAAVTALQRLIETQPAQKADWLAEMVHVRQDQGNLDEALKSAQAIIDASPTNADGYMLYSEIAFAAAKPDDAVAKLQAAIKVSDKANDIRQRLARYYLESGQSAKARTIYDDAFAAAESPQDKLTIVRAMTAAYFQDGQIEELINRFKKEQSSEEGGWRYGLYLSAIDEQMEDYGGARRELAKSLAVRPNDTGLLHSLIGLAEKENDLGELLRYREMLATADPNATNEIALANEYAQQDKAKEAWRIVQKNMGEVVKDPLAWKDVLNQISDPDYAAKIKGVLEEAIRSKGDSFEGKFALVQFQMQQSDLEGAKGTLWEILAEPLPPPAPPKPAPTGATAMAFNPFGFGFYQSPLFQRVSQSYVAMNEAQQLMTTSQMRNQMRQQTMMMQSIYNRMGVSTTLDANAIKDHALIYLSVIAVQQRKAEDFLKNLEAKFDAWHLPISERLVAYALIQAREPLLATIEEQAKSGAADKDLDQFCFMECEQFENPMQTPDATMRDRAQAAQKILSARLGQDPKFKSMAAMMQLNQMAADTSPEGMAKRKAAVDEYLKTIDRKKPEELLGVIGLCAQVGEWDEIKKALDDLEASDKSKWGIMMTQQLSYLPMSLLQQTAATKDTTAKQVIPAILELMRLSYPATPPRTALVGTQPMGFMGRMGYYNQNMFPPGNRYFAADRAGILQQLFQQLQARKMVPDMYAALDQEEKNLTDWRKIYPELLRIYFQWWDGKKDDAIASVRTLSQQDSSDDFKQLLAAMLTQNQKYDDAIPVLESVSARYGPDYIHTQMQLLHTARMAKNNDVGQKAALRLLALRLPQQEQMQIIDDMRNVGLKDKADEIVAKQSSGGPGANFNQAMMANNRMMETLNNASTSGDETQAMSVARQILNRDPMSASPYGNDNYLRVSALNVLKRTGQIESYAQDVEKQLQAAPDSVRLNWLAAEAYQNMDDHFERTVGLGAMPQWVKLTRTGNVFEGFTSQDGTNWKSAGQTEIDLPPKVCVGFWVSAERTGVSVKATLDQIAYTGKTSLPVAPAPDTSPAPTALANGTNAASAVAPDAKPASTNVVANPAPAASSGDANATSATAPLPAPWTQTDIGTVKRPGSAAFDASGALSVKGALGGQPPLGGGEHYVYQMLEGDGSLVARVTQLSGSMQTRSEMTGIMVREMVDVGSRGAMLVISPTRGIEWRTRAMSDGGATANAPAASEQRGWSGRADGQFTTPIWLKLSRKGDTFTGSASTDGQHWGEVFSKNLAIGPDARAGVMFAVNDAQDSQATWSDIKVNPTQTAGAPAAPAPDTTQPTTPQQTTPGGSTALPPPWQFIDVGEPTQHGSAQFSGGVLTISSAVPIQTGDERSYSMVYQTVHGDGAIVAQLTAQKEPGYQRHDGLCFRSSLAKDSPEIEFYRVGASQVGYYVNTNTADQALHYFKRVAELDPKNQTVLVQIAEQLRRAKRPGDAADIYAAILKADFVTGMNQSGNVIQAFEEANRMPDLVKIITDWTPPPLNPVGGGQTDMYFQLMQVANQLKQKQQLPEAEQVFRKAISIESFQSKQDGVASLAQILIEENRNDEAAAEIEKFLMNSGPPPAAAQPILGFNVQYQVQNNWFQSMGWNQNGTINSPMVHLLEMADEVGLSTKLQQELKTRADKKGTALSSTGMLDSDRLTALLIAIMAHDPGYRADLDKMLKDSAPTAMNWSSNGNAFMILAQELAKWPQERPEALKLVLSVYEGIPSNQNTYFKNIAGLQVMRIALAANDHKTAQATLKAMGDAIREQRATNANQVQLEQTLMVVRWMIQEGMLKEAADQLADAKTDPQLANNNVYYQQKIDQVQNELAFAKGDPGPVELIYGLADGGKKAGGQQVFWQINPGVKNMGRGTLSSTTVWMASVPTRPTTYKLEIKGGPDPDHLTTAVASYPNVATRGSQAIRIPAGVEVVQASLIGKTDAVAPAVALGHFLLLGNGENLVKNPNFDVMRDASGKVTLAGWSGLGAEGVSQQTGGPTPSGAYASIESTSGMFGGAEITSDKIALQPNTDYVFGCWARLSGNFGFRFSDATGKVLNPNQYAGGGNEQEWVWRSWILRGNAQSSLRGEQVSIPDNAVFVQVVITPNQGSDVAGISLRMIGAAAPVTVPAPAVKP